MVSSPRPTRLYAYYQTRLDLWHSATIELTIGPESQDPFVQAAVEAVLAWLRGTTATPGELMETYGAPHGPLGQQLQLVGSLLNPGCAHSGEPPRLWWWIVKTAYYRRWHELTCTDAEPRSRERTCT
jgi:hypothetical protein